MTYLPHFVIGLITGACIAFAVLIEYIMRTREPADMPHRCDGDEQPATPPPPADDRLDFAAITDALRKKE
jgi:hypothetical protein